MIGLNRMVILEKKFVLAMSAIPSLSVWSSVKFPFPKHFDQNKVMKRYSVESCDLFIQRNYEESRAERAPEMVNLRVPFSRGIEKENSVPNLYCECTNNNQNFPKHKKKNRHIKFVTVPEIIFYDKDCAITTKKFSHFQNNFELGELDLTFRGKNEETEIRGLEEKPDKIDSIPAVKPWTLEELVEINRQKEEAKKKTEAKKNKKNENILKSQNKALKTSNRIVHLNGNLTFSRDSDHRDYFTDFAKYSENCELYQSKLGLNSGCTEKVKLL